MADLMTRAAQLSKNVVAWADPRQVGFIILYVTNRCNFRCNFCFYYAEIEKGRKPNELTVDEIDRIARATGRLLQLSMTGGEPFIRKELADITATFIENTGVRYITIPTNASLTGQMVRYLDTVLPKYPDTFFRLTFSIDGIGEEHDRNRSFPGSFERIVESYKAISPMRKQHPNLVLDSNTVFMKTTEHTTLPTLRYLSEHLMCG